MSESGPYRESPRRNETSRHPSPECRLGDPPITNVEDGISDEQIEWLQRLVEARRIDRKPKSQFE